MSELNGRNADAVQQSITATNKRIDDLEKRLVTLTNLLQTSLNENAALRQQLAQMQASKMGHGPTA